MALPGIFDSEDDGKAGPDSGNAHALTLAELEAAANCHSGLAQVSVQEWAVLLRCKGGTAVAADELVSSLIEWFAVPLSAPEISAIITRLAALGFLRRGDGGRAFQTTALGGAVLEQTQRPLIKGAMWILAHNENEGDGYAGR